MSSPACDRLRAALDRLSADPAPYPDEIAREWPENERGRLRDWVAAVEHELVRAETCLDAAAGVVKYDPDAFRLALEEALWRIDATGERLKVVAASVLGTPVAEKWGQSARIRPDSRKLKAKISELARTYPSCDRLSDALAALDASDANTLRNELAHSLSSTSGSVVIGWVQLVDLDANGGVTHREAFFYTPFRIHPAAW